LAHLIGPVLSGTQPVRTSGSHCSGYRLMLGPARRLHDYLR